MNNRILVIEDYVSISDMVKNCLVREWFSITTAFDGEK